MNNKGMTLVELLITFALLMLIVVGMFNLILDLRLDLDNKKIVKSYIEYSDFVNHDIQYNLVTRKPLAVARSNDGQHWNCYYSGLYYHDDECEVKSDGTFVVDVRLLLGDDQLVRGVTNVTNPDLCSGIYPCAVYAYYDKSDIATSDRETAIEVKFDAIALNVPQTFEGKTIKEYGIKYGKMFEAIPSQKYIDKRIINSSIEFDNDNQNLDGQRNLIINFPLYMTGSNQNYGFMIVYPMYSLEK